MPKQGGESVEIAVDNASRLLLLVFPACLGALAGRVSLFEKPREAIKVLNTYALTFAFPALLLQGLLKATQLPGGLVFWVLWPCALLLSLGLLRWRTRGETAGVLALVCCFGNVAYLGYPYVIASMGETIAGHAALAVSVHVALAVSLGPLLLEQWGNAAPEPVRASLLRVLRLPLFWAPVVGIVLRSFVPSRSAALLPWIQPVASSAAPVALFLIGLYLSLERGRLFQVKPALLAAVGVRMLLLPAVTLGLCLAAVGAGLLDATSGRVHVVLACMPAAITTFSMAHHAGVGEDKVAGIIVWTSLLSLVSLPLWSMLAGWLLA